MSTVDSVVPTDTLCGVSRQFLGVPFRSRTYSHLLYLLVAVPLGIAYFVGLVTGTAIGSGLLLTWVGLPILLATLAGAAAAAGVEALLARRLVGVDAAVPAFVRKFDTGDGLALPGDGFVDAVRRLVTAPSTWTAVVLLADKFVFGVVSFVALVTVGSLPEALARFHARSTAAILRVGTGT